VPESETLETQAAAGVIAVTPDNFNRAESDMYFSVVALKEGGFAKFYHRREPMAIESQTVIRANRDTLYSSAVFDLDAGPVTVTLPDAGGRFMSLIVIDEDQYASAVVYAPGTWTFSKEQIGTRYILIVARTFLDPSDPEDIKKVHALQDAITSKQAGTGRFEVPQWDQASQKIVREALLTLQSTLPDFKKAFGARKDVDPVRHLIGTAAGWGGNPDKDATYLNVTPRQNDGKVVHRLTVRDVPVDGFWSISLYNAEGYYEPNPQNAYSLNNITAKKDGDGSVTIQFGGCDSKAANCLPIMPGWNYTVRLYRPRSEILNGTWTFPEARQLA
jgi:hypothetical protein